MAAPDETRSPLSVAELRALAHRKTAEIAAELSALGCITHAIIVGIADDGAVHANYGVESSGSCLRVEGLASRIAHVANEAWEMHRDELVQ